MEQKKNEFCKECGLLYLSEERQHELLSSLPPEGDIEKLGEFYKVFGDPTRLKILYVLGKMELCVLDIAASLNMSQSAISHQLRLLKSSRLVKARREGKSMFYSLDDNHIKSILTEGLNHITHV